MKKLNIPALCWIILFIWCTGVLAASTMSVQVKNGQVRSTPSFLGRIIEHLNYGDRVLVEKKKGSWSKVVQHKRGIRGWIHTSALTSKKLKLQAGDKDVRTSADSDELALAGKGFNKQVEGEFKAKNPDMDFTWVNRMERMVVSRDEMVGFLNEGKVVPGGGAQ
jgi:hypothetical protein